MPKRALPFAHQLISMLVATDTSNFSFFEHHRWALAHEVKGDIKGAIRAKERQLAKLHEIRQVAEKLDSVDREILLSSFSTKVMLDVYCDLILLLWVFGDDETANATFSEMESMCEHHNVSVPWDDLADDFVEHARRAASCPS